MKFTTDLFTWETPNPKKNQKSFRTNSFTLIIVEMRGLQN